MYLGGEELRFESRVITVGQSSSNLHIRKLKWHGSINKNVPFQSVTPSHVGWPTNWDLARVTYPLRV